MTKKTKYYFTAPLIKRVCVWRSINVICAIACREGSSCDKDWMVHHLRTPDELVDFIQQLPPALRDSVNREFRNIKLISRVPKIKSTILQILSSLPGHSPRLNSLQTAINSRDLAVIAANLCISLPLHLWRELCSVAKHLQAPPSSWLSFTVIPKPGSSLDVSESVQAAFRKAVCSFIFANEGRADEGWCTYSYDRPDDKHCFVLDMTDHATETKEHVGRNQFAVQHKKPVFDILFRYQPALKELAILAEGPRSYRMAICSLWVSHFFAGNAELVDNRHHFRLDRFLAVGETLAVPPDSPVCKAEVISVIIGSTVYEQQEYSISAGRGNLTNTILEFCKLINLSRAELCFKKIVFRFHYLDERGESAYADLYIRPDATNLTRAPAKIRPHLMPILTANGFCHG